MGVFRVSALVLVEARLMEIFGMLGFSQRGCFGFVCAGFRFFSDTNWWSEGLFYGLLLSEASSRGA